jgi:cytochrome c oxidase subunit III
LATQTVEHHSTPGLAHHFDTPEQQKEAATIGMWAFLATEIMLFGGIFMAYIVFRWGYPEIWATAATHLNTPLATLNTVVLLVSSLTVALAVSAVEEGKNRQAVVLLLVTIVLGFGFLGIKFTEYGEKFAHCAGFKDPIAWVTGGAALGENECLVPGQGFIYPSHGETEAVAATAATGEAHGEAHAAPAGLKSPHQIFYFLYFCATGLHAIHMVIGITMMAIITFLTARGKFSPAYSTPVEMGGLYWHLIDIIWVFLFPLFYLV